MNIDPPSFLCDAMLGGLARWLRAAGYEAAFEYGIDDAELVRRAQATGAVLLSSDGQMFERNVIKDGSIRARFVPRGLSKVQQLAHVLGELDLPVRPVPRCMACGGELVEVDKTSIRGEAPPKAYAACERFWRCAGCGKLLWRGTHWRRIAAGLRAAEAGATPPADAAGEDAT